LKKFYHNVYCIVKTANLVYSLREGGLIMKNFFMAMLMCFNCAHASAATVLFIPHDDRPISFHQTVEVVQQTDVNIVVPPAELLKDSHIDELWQWFFDNSRDVSYAVVSSDSLLYGGLIPSRKHQIAEETLDARLNNFEKIHALNPNLKIYVFDSLMRTPYQGTKGDIEEPEYYADYGENIFNWSVLVDKKDTFGINRDEEILLASLENAIPAKIFSDWLSRREKNLAATKKIIQLTSGGVIDYLIIGRDDNSELSQTHREHKLITACAKENNLSNKNFQCMPGIDEFNLLLLARAVNELHGYVPKVNIQFNKGKGGDTVPAFSDETLDDSIEVSVSIAGGKLSEVDDADFILLVNTEEDGETLWLHNPKPDGSDFMPDLKPSRSTKNFARLVEKFVEKNYSVGVADINFANGSDNALMKILQEKNLLFKLRAYSGWNTATNSTGFALATGILTKYMNQDSVNKLLVRRYLDDWGYQANVRTVVGNEIVKKFGNPALYYDFVTEDTRTFAEELNTKLLRDFAEKNLPHFDYLKNLQVKNTWNRMFECDILFSE